MRTRPQPRRAASFCTSSSGASRGSNATARPSAPNSTGPARWARELHWFAARRRSSPSYPSRLRLATGRTDAARGDRPLRAVERERARAPGPGHWCAHCASGATTPQAVARRPSAPGRDLELPPAPGRGGDGRRASRCIGVDPTPAMPPYVRLSGSSWESAASASIHTETRLRQGKGCLQRPPDLARSARAVPAASRSRRAARGRSRRTRARRRAPARL